MVYYVPIVPTYVIIIYLYYYEFIKQQYINVTFKTNWFFERYHICLSPLFDDQRLYPGTKWAHGTYLCNTTVRHCKALLKS